MPIIYTIILKHHRFGDALIKALTIRTWKGPPPHLFPPKSRPPPPRRSPSRPPPHRSPPPTPHCADSSSMRLRKPGGMYFCGFACNASRRAARIQESVWARCWRQIALLLACGRMHHRRPASPASCPRHAGGPQRAMSAQRRLPRTHAGGVSRGLCESILRKAKPAGAAHRILWLVTHGAAAIVSRPSTQCLSSLSARSLFAPVPLCLLPSRAAALRHAVTGMSSRVAAHDAWGAFSLL